MGTAAPPASSEVLDVTPRLLSWVDQAACRDVSAEEIETLFYPRDGLPIPDRTIEMCAACPVMQQCRAAGYEGRYVEGVWGGVDMREVFGRTASRRRRSS